MNDCNKYLYKFIFRTIKNIIGAAPETMQLKIDWRAAENMHYTPECVWTVAR